MPISEEEMDAALEKSTSKAVSSIGLSPFIISRLAPNISPFLLALCNNAILTAAFPLRFLESAVFFLHKKGSRTDPNNYRSLAVENPFLKILSYILTKRITEYAENNELFPEYQFGYRKNRTTAGAAAILYEIARGRLDEKKRTYVAFIDFQKCFDSIRRDLLFVKLQELGIPFQICSLLHYIFSNLQFFIKSGNSLAQAFSTKIALPQGDPISPVLFGLFVHDLPHCFSHIGPIIHGIHCAYLMFADDLAIICETETELQCALNSLSQYCRQNGLKINTNKSKCLVFHRGRLPDCSFFLDNNALEIVNNFCYLGFTFSTQLSFTSHLQELVAKQGKWAHRRFAITASTT